MSSKDEAIKKLFTNVNNLIEANLEENRLRFEQYIYYLQKKHLTDIMAVNTVYYRKNYAYIYKKGPWDSNTDKFNKFKWGKEYVEKIKEIKVLIIAKDKGLIQEIKSNAIWDIVGNEKQYRYKK